MAGHNKWSKIKRKKGKLDKQRGEIFTRFSKMITTLAREGIADTTHNIALKVIVDQAKNINIPKRVIERAINRATGKGDNGQIFHEIIYEAHAQEGIPILILAVTDNKHRTVAEVRNILHNHHGHLGKIGSVTWQFNQKGKIELKPVKLKPSSIFGHSPIEQHFPTDNVIMEILEISEVEDILEKQINESIYLDIIMPFHKLQIVYNKLKKLDFIITDKGVHYIYNQNLTFSKKQRSTLTDLINDFHELDDIQDLWFPLVK